MKIEFYQWCVVATHRDPNKYIELKSFRTRAEAEKYKLNNFDMWFDSTGYLGLIVVKRMKWRFV